MRDVPRSADGSPAEATDFNTSSAPRHAMDIADALPDGCKGCGFQERSGILRSVRRSLVNCCPC